MPIYLISLKYEDQAIQFKKLLLFEIIAENVTPVDYYGRMEGDHILVNF